MDQVDQHAERWAALQRLQSTGEVVEGVVVRATPGGLLVDVGGLIGILPLSRIWWSGGFPAPDVLMDHLDRMVGERIRVKLLEVFAPTNGSRGRLALDQIAAERS